jgi:hypothetical protein
MTKLAKAIIKANTPKVRLSFPPAKLKKLKIAFGITKIVKIIEAHAEIFRFIFLFL